MTAERQPASREGTRARPATAGGVAPDFYTPGHGSGDYQVSRYELHLDYQVTTNRLAGHATITARASTALITITLNLAGLRALEVQLDGQRVTRFLQRGNQLTITPDRPPPAGTGFSLDVRYGGTPAPLRGIWGGVGWEELTDGVLVAGQPIGAPTWFPCNDHPSQKASFGYTITTDANYRVICNGVLISHHANGSRETWVFEQSEPMASYLASVQIGRYDLLPLTFHAHPPAHRAGRQEGPGTVPQFLAAPPALMTKARAALARQGQMMESFQTCFGPYPFTTYTVVVPGDRLEIPLEAQSLSVFGPNHLNQGWESQRLIAHELAHQWFGNSLTAATWADIWLHEGFACYAEWLWSETSGNSTAANRARAAWRGLSVNAQDLVVGDPGPGSMFDERVYTRGALALHALRRAAGDALFFSFLRAWTEEHRFGSVKTTDLCVTANRICGAVPGFDARTILTPWLYRLQLPTL
ncbi:peptidase M1 [Arthrobacter sp. Soil736]|uniref:M1 family metallopeptidase n=1 Tax=Arthrobacter sp. Soil736 TaxID=1736395 RepID=UPI0006F9153F|nr:M1 family metallopeptidase [Arthrobacter sp. Soil736]KRE54845.1 peptidase M1 [Arthrobacter sp. Soil736]